MNNQPVQSSAPPNQPLLTIVTATRGQFSDHWIQSLCAIHGNVEFILVHPPGVTPRTFADQRIKTLVSSYKGEVMQRGLGLLNASGQYVLALDDDDYLHPDITEIIAPYFERCPESWALRPSLAKVLDNDTAWITSPWQPLPTIQDLTLVPRQNPEHDPNTILQAVPIAPLNNRFRKRALWFYTYRIDHHGAHAENFNNIIWRTDLVKATMTDLCAQMHFHSYLIWLPRWSLDRLLGLYLQAKFFQPDQTIGYWLKGSEQVRKVERSHTVKSVRAMFPGDMLLSLRFPQYGYFWNLFFNELWNAIKVAISSRLYPLDSRAVE
jgi:glycosyltransferase involved in cell wall biosynthesis